jgi:hypothetical protein
MDVLVCTTQVPFMRGGLEMMVENLVDALGAAGHRAEAVAVPAAWDRDRVLDAPSAWRMVPLDADLVIPVNFPAYFARHPRKVLWLAHQHRAAYDGLDQPWSDLGTDDASLEVHRQLVDWDTRVLGECLARYTISGVVAERLRRFNGVDATPLYQPPPLADRLTPRPAGTRAPHLVPHPPGGQQAAGPVPRCPGVDGSPRRRGAGRGRARSPNELAAASSASVSPIG